MFNEFVADRECHSKLYWGRDEKGVYYIIN